jgi:alkanesulfonate monooxygenase SsuD/methylene tetrahydromethanopterin reductase-like flavin-dependent oxidoreductase (luciferase family)
VGHSQFDDSEAIDVYVNVTSQLPTAVAEEPAMHVGMTAIFQNPGQVRPDFEVYHEDLALADLAEPLGFESIWSVEHHFTDYTMCPDVLQFLTYMAGRTKKVQLGSMVVVLPWHDPMRVAEQISMLDNISGGRMILGLGRGAGKVEFEGFRVPMGESRERFVESAEMILRGLEQGYCEYDGTYIKQPRAAVRPAPFKSFKGRTYAAAVSPESSRIMAELGIGILIIPQKPWDEVTKELNAYRTVYREVNGSDAPPPISAGWVFCDEDEKRAYELARRYIGGYWETVLKHYQFAGDHLKTTKGYEYYGKMSDKIKQYGNEGAIDFFMQLQIWGTPKQCIDKIVSVSDRTGADSFVAVFSYAGMPHAEAERNMRLFASKVMPALKQLPAAKERSRKVA